MTVLSFVADTRETVFPAKAGIHAEPDEAAVLRFPIRQRKAVVFLPTQKYKVEKRV
jgi:hypothetical protein